MLFVIGAIITTILGGTLLAVLRVQESTWRQIARERRRRWEDSLR